MYGFVFPFQMDDEAEDSDKAIFDSDYGRFVRQQQIGTAILLAQDWSVDHLVDALLFWARMLPTSGDIFVWQSDWDRALRTTTLGGAALKGRRATLERTFRVLYSHGMKVSWQREEKMMLQLQKTVTGLNQAFQKRAQPDIDEAVREMAKRQAEFERRLPRDVDAEEDDVGFDEL